MNQTLTVESLEFTADIAGALEETRVVRDAVVTVIKLITDISEMMR